MWPSWMNMLTWWQWAVLLAVPPAIVSLYFLKLRRRPVEVPSTYLWSRTIEDMHVNSIWQRLRRNLLLLLQLLLMAMLILALLRPAWRGEQLIGRRFKSGVDLSGGQWQKLAIARAYMRDAQVMILDEPTAALDARSEFEVFQRFKELSEQRTAVLISHRFSSVRMADRILVMEQGQLEAAGTHDELMAEGGRYAELFELQAAGYR